MEVVITQEAVETALCALTVGVLCWVLFVILRADLRL